MCDIICRLQNAVQILIKSILQQFCSRMLRPAFVLCNEYAMAQDEEVTPQFELLEWGCDLIPGTAEYMTFYADVDGLLIVVHCLKNLRLIGAYRLSSYPRSWYSQIH